MRSWFDTTLDAQYPSASARTFVSVQRTTVFIEVHEHRASHSACACAAVKSANAIEQKVNRNMEFAI